MAWIVGFSGELGQDPPGDWVRGGREPRGLLDEVGFPCDPSGPSRFHERRVGHEKVDYLPIIKILVTPTGML